MCVCVSGICAICVVTYAHAPQQQQQQQKQLQLQRQQQQQQVLYGITTGKIAGDLLLVVAYKVNKSRHSLRRSLRHKKPVVCY